MEKTGLYIHVPFCFGKCHYCDFYSISATPDLIVSYLTALDREAQMIREQHFEGEKPVLESVYIGGGTPTALTSEELAELGRIVGSHFVLSGDCEFTSEANPESITADKLQALITAGLNRLSMGAQSFDNSLLETIGRRHTGRQTLAAVETARNAGIENISLDLIYAIPDQTLDHFEHDLRVVGDLEIEHLSCYELTYEPETPIYQFRHRSADPKEEEKQIQMFRLADRALTDVGYEHYEVSNYAKPGYRCRHNLRYWSNLDYIGLGPSAAGFHRRRRYKNVSHLEIYCRKLLQEGQLPVAADEILSDLQFAGETAMLALRTSSGIDRDVFKARTGHDPFVLFEKEIDRFAQVGLLRVGPENISLTFEGFLFSNEILSEFLR